MRDSSYNIVVDRLQKFAEGHFYIKSFAHDTLDALDTTKSIEYPIMQVIPGTMTPSQGQVAYSFDIVFADLARRKTDLELNTREIISDMTRIALDLLVEIKNGQVLFGSDVQVEQGSVITSFIDGYENTITGVTLAITIIVQDTWNACIIPADWSTGGTGYPSEGMRVTSIPVLDEGNFVVNAYEIDFRGSGVTVTRTGNTAIVTITGGGGGGGITCEDLPTCEVIVDINDAIDTLTSSLGALGATVSSLSATVGGIQNDITAIEAEQTTQNDNIFTLISDVAALDNRLDGAETNIDNLQSTQLSQGSAITSLTTRVTTAENNIDAIEAEQITQNNRLTTLETVVGNKYIDVTDSSAVTGTTANTIVRSVLIPANTFSAGQVVRIRSRIRKTGTAATSTQRIYQNTTNSLSGANLLGTYTSGAASHLWFQMKREVVIKSATATEVVNATVSANTDDTTLTGAVSTYNINWEVDQYIIFAVQNGNAGDTTVQSYLSIDLDVPNE